MQASRNWESMSVNPWRVESIKSVDAMVQEVFFLTEVFFLPGAHFFSFQGVNERPKAASNGKRVRPTVLGGARATVRCQHERVVYRAGQVEQGEPCRSQSWTTHGPAENSHPFSRMATAHGMRRRATHGIIVLLETSSSVDFWALPCCRAACKKDCKEARLRYWSTHPTTSSGNATTFVVEATTFVVEATTFVVEVMVVPTRRKKVVRRSFTLLCSLRSPRWPCWQSLPCASFPSPIRSGFGSSLAPTSGPCGVAPVRCG